MQSKTNYAVHSDVALTELLHRGDHRAFEQIYNRYWHKLLAIAYFHLRNREGAEEIVQEVLLSLWKRRSDVQLRTLENYLSTATKYAIYASLLKEKRRKALLSQMQAPELSVFDLEEKLEARFLQDHINGVLEALPPKCRLVFTNSRVLGMSNEAIAEEMGLSVKTVEGHITKALKTIRVSLKDHQLTTLTFFAIQQLMEILEKK